MPVQPLFTPLSEADLSEVFRNDADGLRRYRLLHAVLADNLTHREAAAAFAVSERTVRNVLRAYSQGGALEALRSRPARSRRRDRRAPTIERALAHALAEDPEAGGDRLWRRAQELLDPEESARLSRRTAYRILAQLRNDRDDDPPDSLRAAVKNALPLLPEDPPLTLGNSLLAQRLLPADLEQLPRGILLQQALREALERRHLALGPFSILSQDFGSTMKEMPESSHSMKTRNSVSTNGGSLTIWVWTATRSALLSWLVFGPRLRSTKMALDIAWWVIRCEIITSTRPMAKFTARAPGSFLRRSFPNPATAFWIDWEMVPLELPLERLALS